MATGIEKLEISDRFDVDDIRKIREYNAMRHMDMSPQEIVADVNRNLDEAVRIYGLKKPVRLKHL